jgi:hypothetical protein
MLSKLQLPSLRGLVEGAHKNGAVANRLRLSGNEADRIRKAEAAGGHDQGLRIVLAIRRALNPFPAKNKGIRTKLELHFQN